MNIQAFDPRELETVGTLETFACKIFNLPPSPTYRFPVTMKEAVKALYRREPIWQISDIETMMFAPRIYPDNIARALVAEAEQRALAKEYANAFCNPDKPTYMSIAAVSVLTPAYREEMYRQSRINYSGSSREIKVSLLFGGNRN